MTEKEFLKSIGSKIKKIRTEQKLTQVDLALMCSFEKASMSRIESGLANPTILTLRKISIALNIPVSALFADLEHINNGK